MQNVTFAAPILPGKMEEWKKWVWTIANERINEYEESRKKAGVKKEVVWVHHTPQGDMITLYVEAKDIEKMVEHFAKSQAPFDVWFREKVKEYHGFDMTETTPLPELGWEWPASK